MSDYIVNRTDIDAPSITVPEKRVNSTSLDVSLFGKIRLEYGEALDEDLLNVLENFACPEDTASVIVIPDYTQTSKTQLTNPTIGQFWFNSTRKHIYFWDGIEWKVLSAREDVAANWGQVIHGQQLPKPVSPVSGYVFDYSECIWSIAPAAFLGKIGFMNCATDAVSTVTMQYRLAGTDNILNGQANYLIIGIRDGSTTTGPFPTPPAPSPTASVTPTLTPTPTSFPTPTVTPTLTATVTPSVTPSNTPAPSLTPSTTTTPAVTPTMTPTPAPSSTPAVSPTPTPVPPLSSIVIGGDYDASSVVLTGGCAGAGIGFLANGVTAKSGLSTDGPPRWLAVGYNASDFEVSFTGSYSAQFPGDSNFATPAGSNTMGAPGAWYNLGSGTTSWSCGTCRDIVNFFIGYTIRRVGDPSQTVTGSISLSGLAGTPV